MTMTEEAAPRVDRAELVRAAGAVCWHRRGAGEPLRVLLVHRPRYDDWSWPKGKLDGDELLPTAAVREVEEETGLSVTLGIPLPPARYRLGTTVDKHVAYWAANIPDDGLPDAPRPHEVDRAEWVDPDEAGRRLTRRGDRVQLQALLDADTEDMLDTFALLVVRHAHSLPRDGWDGDDAARPLSPTGDGQAEALVPLVSAWAPRRVLTSPWERCVATVRRFADTVQVPVEAQDALTEDGHRQDSGAVSALVTTLLEARQSTVVCTHRPVLGTLLGALAGNVSPGAGDGIPRSDPFLEDGEVLVAHASARSGRVVAIERHVADPQ